MFNREICNPVVDDVGSFLKVGIYELPPLQFKGQLFKANRIEPDPDKKNSSKQFVCQK